MAHSKVKKLLTDLETRTGEKHISFRRRINQSILQGGGQYYHNILEELQNQAKNAPTQLFTTDDYNSSDGFQTPVWGPLLWNFLHMVSLNYRPEKEQEYRNFLQSLQKVLPCLHCRTNFSKNSTKAIHIMEQLPKGKLSAGGSPYQINSGTDIYKSRAHFARYMWQLHHEVNTMLGKDTTNEPSFEKIRDQYETFRSRCLTKEEIEMRKAEAGCTAPIYGADAKAKCQIAFVPRVGDGNKAVKKINIDPRCQIKKNK